MKLTGIGYEVIIVIIMIGCKCCFAIYGFFFQIVMGHNNYGTHNTRFTLFTNFSIVYGRLQFGLTGY